MLINPALLKIGRSNQMKKRNKALKYKKCVNQF